MEACFNEEDRKRKGEAIVSVAGKILEKAKEKSYESEKILIIPNCSSKNRKEN